MSEAGNNIDTSHDVGNKTESTPTQVIEADSHGTVVNIEETLENKCEDVQNSFDSSPMQPDNTVGSVGIEANPPVESSVIDESLCQTVELNATMIQNITSPGNQFDNGECIQGEKKDVKQESAGADDHIATEAVDNNECSQSVEERTFQDEDNLVTTQDAEKTSISITADIPSVYEDNQSIYNIKWIQYHNNKLPIITQNENGPCPLLAIMNYLLLQKTIVLSPSTELVTSSNLISYLADYIFEHVPNHISEDTILNYEQKMHDAMAMFPKLQTGLDVNVRFTGVTHFEYTSSCEVFDLLDIPLYHTWLVDPEAPEVVAAVGNATYNQLVEKIINDKSSSIEERAREALVAEEFLRTSASQMTYHGLCELSSTLQDSMMGILFRNNHFHTVLKHDGQLYVLATDQGFLQESGVVWETLSNIEGDSHFVDANFKVFQHPGSSSKPPVQMPAFANTNEQINQDYLVALSLQREQNESTDQPWSNLGLSDHDLAVRLQEEENKLAETGTPPADRQQAPTTGQQRQRVTTSSATSVNKDKKDFSCTVM